MVRDWIKFPELWNSEFEIYYFDSPHKQITSDFTAKCIEVIDGDTIRVKWFERDFDFPVRLIDIDAPELNAGGHESRKWLESQISGEEIDILVDPNERVDKWGRILGRVLHRGMSMNELSLLNGHSVPFERRDEVKLWR